MMRLKMIVLFALFSQVAVVSYAHRLILFATTCSSGIVGRAFFSGGRPAIGIPVTAQDPSGRELAQVRTDREGRFFVSGLQDRPLVVVAETTDGHRAEFRLAGSADLPAAPRETSVEGSGQGSPRTAEIEELLHRLETRIYLRDILGGIGYIVGVWGAWALVLARRRSPSDPARRSGAGSGEKS